MTMDFSQFNEAPQGGAISDDQRREAVSSAEAANAAAVALKDTPLTPPPAELQQYRAFISPTHPNGKFLVKRGTLLQFNDPNSPTGKRDAQRQGDIFAEFAGGVLVTDDPDVIAWAQKHDGFHYDDRGRRVEAICRDATDNRTAAWVEFKKGQQNLANREPSIPQDMDIDQMMYPDEVGKLRDSDTRKGTIIPHREGNVVDTALRALADRNERKNKI